MPNSITYEGYLTFELLSQTELSNILKIADRLDFPVFITSTSLEIDTKKPIGDEVSRDKLVKFLHSMATIIHNADGEIRLESVHNSDAIQFEFYTLQNNRIYQQVGELKKQPPVKVETPQVVASDLLEYNGEFCVTHLSEDIRLESHSAQSQVTAKIGGNCVQFFYAGRDAQRWFVHFLKGIAEILQDTEGEVRCEIETENLDPDFEFYFIDNASLYQRRGQIIRTTPPLEKSDY
jgi:hypothetical protein